MTSRMEVAYIIKTNVTTQENALTQNVQLHRRYITVGTACACTFRKTKRIHSFLKFLIEK